MNGAGSPGRTNGPISRLHRSAAVRADPSPCQGRARRGLRRPRRELHREVALKEIQARYAEREDQRARFLLEAEITGGLEHPGIVPVYGLGTYADGRPYYAMRFIRGDSLKEAIARFHADEAPSRDPGERGRWSCASCCGGSSTSATRSPTPTAGACCTATSSRATSCSASTARPWSSTGAWPRPSGTAERRRRRRGRADRCGPTSASGVGRDAAGLGARHAGVHEPRAGRAGDSTGSGPASDVYSLGATLYAS